MTPAFERPRAAWAVLCALAASILVSGCSTAPDRELPSSEEGAGLRARIVEIARAEWVRWGRQQHGGGVYRRGHREGTPELGARVRRYYRLATGREPEDVTRIGWSSAFVAWVLYRASGGREVAYRGPHAANIRRAIAARHEGREGAQFVAYRPGEIRPRPGDLVCVIQSPGFSFDHPAARFRAHCDFAVRHRPGSLDLIGGNLSDSVTLRTVRTDPQGRVLPSQRRALDPSVYLWGLVIRVNG